MAAALGLGTVQFGGSYGISNEYDVPTALQVSEILAEARNLGVKVLDTASLYCGSEDVLGQQDLTGFNIVTKTPRFGCSVIRDCHAVELKSTFCTSLNHLKQPSVYALLCHHAEDLLASGGELLWKAMEGIKAEGKVQNIGVSIYDGSHLDQLMARYPMDIVQIPVNVLDQRLIRGGQLERMRKAEIEVHARSVFLQGLLLMDDYPEYFDPIKPYLTRWRNAAVERGIRPTQAALAFVRDQQGIDVVLVGVANLDQLNECVSDFSSNNVFIGQNLACDIPEFVDPSKWGVK